MVCRHFTAGRGRDAHLFSTTKGEKSEVINQGQITSVSLCSQLCKQAARLFTEHSSVPADGRERQSIARQTRKLLSGTYRMQLIYTLGRDRRKASLLEGCLVLCVKLPSALSSLTRGWTELWLRERFITQRP